MRHVIIFFFETYRHEANMAGEVSNNSILEIIMQIGLLPFSFDYRVLTGSKTSLVVAFTEK